MDSTYLSTMAQLSGVVVGFANLANAIYKPHIQAKEFQLNKVRILTSTELGFFNMIACVLPLLFMSKETSPILLFKLLSLVIFISLPLYGWANAIRSERFLGTKFPVPYMSKLFTYAGGFGGILGGLNTLEIFGEENVIFIYQLILFVCFLIQAILFLRLISWILSNQDKAVDR